MNMSDINPPKSSWADEVKENYENGLPPSAEYIKGNFKYTTEYKYNEEGKKIKIMRTYKIEKQMIQSCVSMRRKWKKFGESANDKPGPNSHTTLLANKIVMEFIDVKKTEQETKTIVDPGKKIAKCRICDEDHWSVNCPYKGTSMDTKTPMEDEANAAATATSVMNNASKSGQGKYVPPFMKKAKKCVQREPDEYLSVRISNLPESMTETDMEELVLNFGPITKLYLPRDKKTGNCKGFAYVHFKYHDDAVDAIKVLQGHGYDHLILIAEWSKTQN